VWNTHSDKLRKEEAMQLIHASPELPLKIYQYSKISFLNYNLKKSKYIRRKNIYKAPSCGGAVDLTLAW